jgi:hypothetical protein
MWGILRMSVALYDFLESATYKKHVALNVKSNFFRFGLSIISREYGKTVLFLIVEPPIVR